MVARVPWWGWVGAFLIIGWVVVKWYSNESANNAASSYLNPPTSQTPFDNGVQSDLSTATVEELLQYENEINTAAAGAASTTAGNGASLPPGYQIVPFLTGPHNGNVGTLTSGGSSALQKVS